MGLFMGPSLLILLLLALQVLCWEKTGCTFNNPHEIRTNSEPEGTPLILDIDILIIGLREVTTSGGSFDVDVEITVTWEDRRFVQKKKDGVIHYNEHRKTECPSNHVTYDDTYMLWKPYLEVLNALEVHGFLAEEASRTNFVLKYDVETGKFSLKMKCHAKIKCPMRYSVYPFDSQTCQFALKSATKNMTFQELTTNMTYKTEILYMDMFDIYFSPLRDKTYLTQTKEMFSLAGFLVTMKRSPMPYYMNVYLPTGLLTITSLIGFLIPPDIVPGRMALLVTIFLMLVNISSTERNRGPATRTVTYMDIWLLLCMAFVLLALAEYAVILGLRFNNKKNKIHDDKNDEEAIKHRCRMIDSWALKIFAGLDILTVGTYFYCVYTYYA